MFIRSERLFLRPGWPEDWLELLEAIDDEAVLRNLARAPWPYTADDAKAFLGRQSERALPQLFITLPSADGAKLIGNVGLARNGDDVEIGYWIARPYWGQGYATEAARAMLRLARTLGHRRLIAGHFIDNPESGRVLRKIGFEPTGQRRIRYSEGRKGVGMAESYAVDLGVACDCDTDVPAMRAA